jgi:hypothetical protein
LRHPHGGLTRAGRYRREPDNFARTQKILGIDHRPSTISILPAAACLGMAGLRNRHSQPSGCRCGRQTIGQKSGLALLNLVQFLIPNDLFDQSGTSIGFGFEQIFEARVIGLMPK